MRTGQKLRFLQMNKDTRLTLRVRPDLKKELSRREVARICEAFLSASSDACKIERERDCRGG